MRSIIIKHHHKISLRSAWQSSASAVNQKAKCGHGQGRDWRLLPVCTVLPSSSCDVASLCGVVPSGCAANDVCPSKAVAQCGSCAGTSETPCVEAATYFTRVPAGPEDKSLECRQSA